jgi:ribosomal protein L32
MPSYRVSKSSSTKRRAEFVRRLFSIGVPAMVACSRCEAACSLCVFAEGALKCNEYVRKGRVCDSTFLGKDFDRIKKKKKKLRVALRAALECS